MYIRISYVCVYDRSIYVCVFQMSMYHVLYMDVYRFTEYVQ